MYPNHPKLELGQLFPATILTLPDTGADLDAIPEAEYIQTFYSITLRPGVEP